MSIRNRRGLAVAVAAALAAAGLTTLPISAAQAAPGDPVVFGDSRLQACAELEVGLAPVTEGDAALVTSLSCDYLDINDLTGLEKFTGLEVLSLTGNQIGDLGPLSHLTSLEELSLALNQVSDISDLAGLHSLTALNLAFNQISDISPLANLNSLTALSLDGNQVTDAGPLGTLTSLTYLVLTTNQITDVSPLGHLTSLTYLYLSQNQITDVSALAGLNSLTLLWLDQNQITDISPLARLTDLTDLFLYKNLITDVSPLAGLNLLGVLSLDSNRIIDLSSLSGQAAAITTAHDQRPPDLSASVGAPISLHTVTHTDGSVLTGTITPNTYTVNPNGTVTFNAPGSYTFTWNQTVPGIATIFSGQFTIVVAASSPPPPPGVGGGTSAATDTLPWTGKDPWPEAGLALILLATGVFMRFLGRQRYRAAHRAT